MTSAAVTLGIAIPALVYALMRVGAALYIDCHASVSHHTGLPTKPARPSAAPRHRPTLFGGEERVGRPRYRLLGPEGAAALARQIDGPWRAGRGRLDRNPGGRRNGGPQ
jgi:hypothetical protein